MVAIIGRLFERFRPLVDLYRESGLKAGHSADQLAVGVHAMGFVGESTSEANDAFFPGWWYMVSTIGRERGWSAPSRQQFDAMCGPGGAFLLGDPPTVAYKMLGVPCALGAVKPSPFQFSSPPLWPPAI